MKWLCALVLASASPLLAADDPAAAAVDFLKKVREKNVNLEPGADTALMANTAAEKRKEILRRLENLAQDVVGGELIPGESRVDGELAAVLVRNGEGFDPARLQVFAVALVRREGKWLPAPVLSSFENSGVGYTLEVRRKLRELEDWMLRQRVLDLETLRADATARMRRDIQARITADELHEATAAQVGRRFVEACGKRDLPVMLGLLGGLREVLPADWSLRLKAADAAVGDGARVKLPWRLLVAPEVLRTVVHEETSAKSGLISIACLDPVASEDGSQEVEVQLVHLKLTRDRDQLWQVDPPARFLLGEEPLDDEDEDFEDGDEDLIDRFTESLREDVPAAPQQSANEAIAALEQAFRAPDMQAAMALLDVSGSARTARLGCARLAQAWGALNQTGEPRQLIPMGSHEVGGVAVTCYQFFSLREPDKADIRHFYLTKTDDGWLLMPGLRPAAKAQGDAAEVRRWVDGKTREWSETWREKVLASAAMLKTVPESGPPTQEEAKELITGWLKAVREGDLAGMLRGVAWQGGDAAARRVLRNLQNEHSSTRRVAGVPVIVSTFTDGPWTAVGVKSGEAEETTYPFYPVVKTPDGPRLLIEIDLIASDARTRKFLNEDSWKRLDPITEEAARRQLVELFERFRKERLGE